MKPDPLPVPRFQRTRVLPALMLLCSISGVLSAEYPLIRYTVSSRDPLYRQQQQDVEDWYGGRLDAEVLALYRYRAKESEDLFAAAAAFNLPYDALASLNGWDSPVLFSSERDFLVPNIPGIFVPVTPRNSWETLLAKRASDNEHPIIQLETLQGKKRKYRFFPGEKFTQEERIRFLGSLFASPLGKKKITSPFGYRPHPFTGQTSFHPGVDMRAAVGTPVKAAREGVVIETGTLEIYGHFVILSHEGDYQTVYAHLKEILVETGEKVATGHCIAYSGNSGISTGPHLHFEIRRQGIPVNPVGITSFTD